MLAGLVAIAVIVGAATHTDALSGGPSVPRGPLVVFLQTLFWLVVAMDVVLAALAVSGVLSDRRKKKQSGDDAQPRIEPPQLHWAVRLAMLITSFTPAWVLIAIILIAYRRHQQGEPLLFPVLPAMPRPGQRFGASAAAGADNNLVWLSLGIALAIVAGVAAWLWIRRSRPSRSRRLAPSRHAELLDVVEESLDELRADPDPRQAVIAAYSSMERSFRRIGLPRAPFEAPLEFVARVLSSVGAATEVRDLTDLFELAKFSEHEIDEAMRSSAIDALSRIRDELRTREAA